MKRDRYTCQECKRKQSKAQGREFAVEVHHKVSMEGRWESVINSIYEHLLCNPDELEVLCPECHQKRTEKEAIGI
jgi:5-methylcytosine-specific restriction endonuclease McrA